MYLGVDYMEEVGYVTSIRGEFAFVTFKRKSGCGDNCASCKAGCAANPVLTEIKNTMGAKVGDQVKVAIKQSAYNKMILWVYVFPLIMLAIGIIASTEVFQAAGLASYELYSFLVGILALAISYAVLSKVSKKTATDRDFNLEMTEIVK
jgi:sigma-E factor negative regulatory protein RseC